jgi:hypothetical protein
MRKALIVLTTAALVAGSALTGSAVARDRTDRAELPANQIADQADARTAHIKADLRLTPEQEKNWSGFESAMHDLGKKPADRAIAARSEEAQQKSGPVNAIELMRKEANLESEHAVDQKALADAAQPLYASLDAQQKRRFADELKRLSRERGVN